MHPSYKFPASSPFYLTWIRNAVVWGGILAVWKFAWVICTSWPGRRSHNLMGNPFLFRITVELVTIYLVILLILFGMPARSWLLLQSIQITLCVVVLAEGLGGCLVTIVNAVDWGGMLRVILGENVTSTRIPGGYHWDGLAFWKNSWLRYYYWHSTAAAEQWLLRFATEPSRRL